MLVADMPLPRRYCDHPLSGDWSDCRDCHIRPDLVLIYRSPTMTASNLCVWVRTVRWDSEGQDPGTMQSKGLEWSKGDTLSKRRCLKTEASAWAKIRNSAHPSDSVPARSLGHWSYRSVFRKLSFLRVTLLVRKAMIFADLVNPTASTSPETALIDTRPRRTRIDHSASAMLLSISCWPSKRQRIWYLSSRLKPFLAVNVESRETLPSCPAE